MYPDWQNRIRDLQATEFLKYRRLNFFSNSSTLKLLMLQVLTRQLLRTSSLLLIASGDLYLHNSNATVGIWIVNCTTWMVDVIVWFFRSRWSRWPSDRPSETLLVKRVTQHSRLIGLLEAVFFKQAQLNANLMPLFKKLSASIMNFTLKPVLMLKAIAARIEYENNLLAVITATIEGGNSV